MELEDQIAALSARVEELERQVAVLSHQPPPPPGGPAPPGADAPPSAAPPVGASTAPPAPSPAQPAPPPPLPPRPQPPPPQLPVPTAPSRPDWLTTETVLKWAGILLVVLAAVFFVGTAISRGWIGPELQLAGATAGGSALIGAGFHLIDRNRPWAAALATGGAIVVAICAAATNGGLDLIDEYPALAVLGVVTVGLAWIGHRLSVQTVMAAAGVAAAILPLWIFEDVDVAPAAPAAWTAGLVIGTSGFTWFRGWAAARLATVAIAALVLLGSLADVSGDLSRGEQWLAAIVVAVVALVAWAGPVASGWLGRAGADRAGGLDHRAVLSIPLWTWGAAVMITDPTTDRSVAVTGFAVAAAFAVLAVAGLTRLPRTIVASHALGIAILTAISMAVLTDGPGLLVGLAAQAAATALIAWWLGDRWLLAASAAVGVFAVGWAAQSTLAGLFDRPSTGQLLANLFVIALVGVAAFLLWYRSPERLIGPLVAVAWIGALGWIASAVGHEDQGQVVVSLVWSVLAAAALVHGIRAADSGARLLGLCTLGVVLVKLLTVDLAEVDTLWRVGLFLVVGTGLLRLGYILPRLAGTDDGETTAAEDEPSHQP